jgi:exo-1,4-beta-D-glucosaminidase
MLNNAWPGLIWHLYSYDLRPAGGYFGSKKALELIHIQYSYDDRTVAIVNGGEKPQNDLKIVAKVYDTSMKEVFSREASASAAADGVAKSFAMPELAGVSSTYFLNLQLFAPNGELLSRNFYWLTTHPDVPDFSKSEWYYTPLTEFADFHALQDLPKATVRASMQTSEAGNDTAATVNVENTSSGLAFLVRLRLLKVQDGPEILPVFWDDNYLCLLPGEKRRVTVKVRKSDLGSAQPVLAVDGFNVAPAEVK